MAFDIGAGLSSMGTSVAKLSGEGALDVVKADQEQEKLKLVDQLMTQREHVGRQEQAGIDLNKQAIENKSRSDIENVRQSGEDRRNAATVGAHRDAATITAEGAKEGHRITQAGELEKEKQKGQNMLDADSILTKSRETIAANKLQNAKDVAAASSLSPEALKIAGKLKNLGVDVTGYGRSIIDRRAIDNEAAQQAKDENLSPEMIAQNKLGGKGLASAYATMEKQFEIRAANAGAADAAGSVLLDYIKIHPDALGPTGSPAADQFAQAVKKWVAGDPAVTGLESRMGTYLTEMSKVLSGASGAAGVSVDQRRDIAEKMSKATNFESIKSVMYGYSLDKDNVLAQGQQALQNVKDQIGRGASSPASSLTNRPEAPSVTQSNPRGLPAAPTVVVDGKTRVDPNVLKKGNGYRFNVPETGLDYEVMNGDVRPLQKPENKFK